MGWQTALEQYAVFQGRSLSIPRYLIPQSCPQNITMSRLEFYDFTE